jgi:hypothetical protein
MTQEDKDLLLKDLCGRLDCGVKVKIYNHYNDDFFNEFITIENISTILEKFDISDIKPYLYPISSMPKEHKKYVRNNFTMGATHELFDFLDRNCYDYRGLIDKGLAINEIKH